jgi:hypothetical protein
LAHSTRPSYSSQSKLQAAAQDAGEILPYDRGGALLPHPGWCWRPSHARPKCTCAHCAAARAGQPSYLGFHDRAALLELAAHHTSHPELYA